MNTYGFLSLDLITAASLPQSSIFSRLKRGRRASALEPARFEKSKSQIPPPISACLVRPVKQTRLTNP